MLSRKHYRTKCIGVRVRESDFDRLQSLADAEGKSLGEWSRDVLLEKLVDRKRGIGDQTVVLSEVLALRTIQINALFSLAKGQEITEERMNELIEQADSDKLKRAARCLKQPFADDGRL